MEAKQKRKENCRKCFPVPPTQSHTQTNKQSLLYSTGKEREASNYHNQSSKEDNASESQRKVCVVVYTRVQFCISSSQTISP